MDERAIRDEAFYLVAKLVGRSDPSRLEAWAGLGLTITQLRVLFMLRAEAGLAAGSLAEKLGVTPSTLTRIVDRLARNELVRRDAGEDDRRLVGHWLTASGLAVVEEIERTGRERMDRVFDRMSAEELHVLVKALESWAKASDAADEAEETARVGV